MLSTREKNIFFVGQIAGNTYYTVAFNGVLTLFLLKIGVKEGLLGFLSIIPFIVGIASFFIVSWVEKNFNRILRPNSCILVLLGFLLLPLFLLAEKIGYHPAVVYYTIFSFLYWASSQVSTLAWFPVVQLWVDESERGRFLGTLRFTSTIVGFLFLRLSSYLLGPDPSFSQFFYIMLAVTLFSIIWPVSYFYVRMPDSLPEKKQQEKPALIFRDVFSDFERRIYFCFYFVWNLIAYIIAPFMMPFYKMELNLPSSFCVFLSSLSILGMGALAFIWGKVNDFRGSRFVLLFSFILGMLWCLMIAHVHLFPADGAKKALIFISLFGGIAGGGQLMGDTTRRFLIAPEKNRVAFFSYLVIFGGQLPALIIPPISGRIIESHRNISFYGYGIYQLLFLLVGLFHIVLIAMILKMKPIKEKPVGEVFKDVVTENLMKLRDLIANPP
ncbi:MAG: MFS transporter [Candidatus Omnitrophica bacterium]|nr:MFS transporter [Candidatus Omnitrophota bacterium]